MSQHNVAQATLPDRSDSSLVHLSDAVTFQWLYDGAAYMIEVKNSRRDTIDVYIDTSLKIVAEWDRSMPFHSLQDISSDDFQMTPYLKARLNEVLTAMSESGMDGRSIIVMSDGFAGRIMQVLGRFFAQQSKPIIQDWVVDRAVGEEKLAQIMADR